MLHIKINAKVSVVCILIIDVVEKKLTHNNFSYVYYYFCTAHVVKINCACNMSWLLCCQLQRSVTVCFFFSVSPAIPSTCILPCVCNTLSYAPAGTARAIMKKMRELVIIKQIFHEHFAVAAPRSLLIYLCASLCRRCPAKNIANKTQLQYAPAKRMPARN